MDGRTIEPRKTMWAVAEVTWEDDSGTSFRAPATLEDTSPSGACIRVQRPFTIGSQLTIRWHREQFSAIARNCRRDGKDFVLGLQRGRVGGADVSPDAPREPAAAKPSPTSMPTVGVEELPPRELRETVVRTETICPAPDALNRDPSLIANAAALGRIQQTIIHRPTESPPRPQSQTNNRPVRSERKVMQPKTLFPQFWRRQQDGDTPAKSMSTEAPVNKPSNHATEAANGPRGDLLSYEDIYRAAGIMSPGSGYGIHKVVEMLNSERIRDLSKDVKRASVLMALDAAGTSVDELLTDATRRQNALNAYEAAQRKQLEDFEAHKAKENSRIEEEIEKIRAHYAQRIQANLDQVAKEKDSLHNW